MIRSSSLIKFLLPMVFLFLSSCAEPEPEVSNSSGEDEPEAPAKTEQKTILFFGNSLTAGMGLEPEESFPALIQDKIDSLGLKYEVINAGLSGETTAAGKNRISWVLSQAVDVFVLELGANDGLRGIPLRETRNNLQAIIDTVRKKSPDAEIVLAGMQIPPNMGPDYTTKFRKIYPQLAQANDIHLIPFLLEGVAGKPELNQPDGIHPTAEGQRIVAANVWAQLEEIIRTNEPEKESEKPL